MQRAMTRLAEKDARRRVFAHNMAPDAETPVRKWPTTGLDGFRCDLQAVYTPHVIGPAPAGTRIVSNDAPPLHAMARTDEAGMADARGLTPSDAVKAPMKATGSNPRMSVCGWPFCMDDAEGGAV